MNIFAMADHLTGAAETANYFRTRSNKVRVGFESAMPWDFTLGSNVVQVFDSETRTIEKDRARERVKSGLEQLRINGCPYRLFKKIDSTMRGHVGAETRSVLGALGRHVALLTPAFPTSGRTVRDGLLYVDGTLVSLTTFAKDPTHPIASSRIADLIEAPPDVRLFELNLGIVRNGVEAVRNELKALKGPFSIVT